MKRGGVGWIGGVVAVLAGLAGPAEAVSPKTWLVSGVAAWSETERDSVGLVSSGGVRMGLARERVEGTTSLTVWDFLADGDSWLAATGDEGAVYRIPRRGDAVEVVRVVQPQVTALGRDRGGSILLGTAPDGVVYRMHGSTAESLADLPETYVWAIRPHPRGGALVATGNAGKLYRIEEGGRVTVVAETGASHVTGFEVDGTGVVATTESPGRLLRIALDGTVQVLHEGDEPELRAPVLAADGAMYFLANREGTDDPGRLYRRASTGAVERVWESLNGYAYTLHQATDGVLWVSTGSESGRGSIVRVEPGPPSVWTEMVRTPEPQIPGVAMREGRPALIGTGGLGRIYRIPGDDAPSGRVTSLVHDAGVTARWGAMTLEPGPGSAGVEVHTRSGNTRVPDAAWSPWEPARLEGNRGPVPSGPGRFLQWRLDLEDRAHPVSGVRVIYLPANRAPRINDVAITELGRDFEPGATGGQIGNLSQELPGGIRAEFQLPGPVSTGEVSDEETVWARRYRSVTWKADDPNDDALRFRVALRTPEEADWKPLSEDLESSPWVWDSATVPDGWYEVQVEASDAGDNGPGAALTSARATEPFLVDNTPPSVEGLSASGGRIRGTAVDAASAIKRIEMAVDGGPWIRIHPSDGIPDMPRETFEAELPELTPGAHVALVRAADRAGNLGIGRVRFEVP